MSLKVLIASYLEPEHINRIREAVPQVEVIYRPDLIGAPLYQAHHTAVIKRTAEQEANWRELLARADDGALQSEIITGDGELTGGDILPGFRLPLARLFTS